MTLSRISRILRQRLRSVSRKRDLDQQLDKEIGFHFEQLVKENIAGGMSPHEARLAARRTLGNVPLLEEQCRDERRVTWFHDLGQDVHYALRQFARDRTATLVLILTIALGIGVNTTVFSLVNGLARPLPVRAPEQIVVVAADTKGDETGFAYRFSYPAFQDFRQQAISPSGPFADLFAFSMELTGFNSGGKTSQFFGSTVTGNYFSALGITPARGRFFVAGEGENAGAEMSVVLGYSFWQKQFGGDPGVIGRQVRINGSSATVIGIAPQGFRGTFSGVDLDGYLPLRQKADESWSREIFTSRKIRLLTVLGRLKPGASVEQAQASMILVTRRLEEQYPDTDKGIGVRVVPETLARPVPIAFLPDVIPLVQLLMLLLAGLVLVLACLNVANILLVRATVRQREMAVRAALGSGRGRLVRQMLAESVLLAMLGAVAGMFLGKVAGDTFSTFLNGGTDWPLLIDFTFDWRVFTYSLLAALFTGVFIGIWPALRASQAHAGAALHDGGRSHSGGPRRQHLRSLLVVAQVAGSLLLLICAGLCMRNLRSAQRLELGFVPDHLLNARMNPEWAGYDQQRTNDFFKELQRRVTAWPEVRSATVALSVPLSPISAGQPVYIEGRPLVPGEQPPLTGCNYVDSSYFRTMQTKILQGRAFLESDSETAQRVAVVNETMANRYWPNENPIGKRFHAGSAESPPWEVVGVAQNGKYLLVIEAPLPYFYVPLAQNYASMRILQLRTSVPPESLSARLEREVHSLDPDIPVSEPATMAQTLGGLQGFLMFRIAAVQTTAMGMLGLALALVGVYGVVSYGAAQRTREIGIRMALGATPRAILAMILARGVSMVIVGVVVGLLGAAAVARVLSFLLYVPATDPLTFLGVPAVLAAVALWACYIPARRATRVDPTVALRHE